MPEINDALIGRMIMLNGLGYDYSEIASTLGVSESTVGRRMRQVSEEARSGDDMECFWKYILSMEFEEMDALASLFSES